MTATPASVPTPPDGLLAAVEEHYGLRVTPRRRLEGGYANDVFLVDSPRGPLVLRRKCPPSEAASIAWEHALVTRLARDLPEVPAPLQAAGGATFFLFEDDAVSLAPMLGGQPADRRDERHRQAAAGLLARLHRITGELELPPRPGIDGVAQLPSLGLDGLPAVWRDRATRQRVEALELLELVEARRPRTGVVHGDFFPGNVLVADGAAVGLVDWEEAHVGPLAGDLANGVWEFCTAAGDGLDRGAARRFVTAYRDAGGAVPPGEDDLIVPLIRVRRILEVLRAPTDRHVDWDYQERNLRAFERLG